MQQVQNDVLTSNNSAKNKKVQVSCANYDFYEKTVICTALVKQSHKKLKDKDNPLNPVNWIHSLAKQFMR